jgi:hypothetical protein
MHPEAHLSLNGRNIPFVNNVNYLGGIFDKRITWISHIEIIQAKVFRLLIRNYTLLKNYTRLLNLQRLKNKILRTIENFPWCIPVRVLHMAFKLPYIHDYITKLYRQPAEVI